MYIENINDPKDVKKLNKQELNILAQEIRDALLKRASIHGGHFGPNFGFVEATIALQYVFNTPDDKIVYDISHQTYPHKMLTGRKDAFLYKEHYDDVSAYSNPLESPHDLFKIGHTSTSISLAAGLVKGRDLNKGKENIIAVIGDGSLTGGEALEGLDLAGEMDSNFIILVNDNQMSIAEVHGGLNKNLKELRETNGHAPTNLFTAFGLDYIYVNEGNNITNLIEVFEKVKDIDHPIVVHINTEKGKGYQFALENKEAWHWHLPFDIETGETLPQYQSSSESYNSLTADFLLQKMKNDPSVIAISAAAPGSLGFNKAKRDLAGHQHIDVGIAEETAAALASGIAKNGGKPIFGTQATFLQRIYDQLAQDIAVNHSPVTIIAVNASIYGMNDVTHVGFYDLAMMSNIPCVICLAPANKQEYLAMLDWSIEQTQYPVVIRMPITMRDSSYQIRTDYSEINKFMITDKGHSIALIAVGEFYDKGEKAARILKEKGLHPTLINPLFVSGTDKELLESLKKDHQLIVTIEDGVIEGGFSSKIASFYSDSDIKVKMYGLDKQIYDRYDADELCQKYRIMPELIAEDILKELQ